MNRCPNCAAQNREGAKFCTSCGFKLPSSELPAAPYSDRSPFATTSSVPSSTEVADSIATEEPVQVDDATTVQSFSTWGAQSEEDSISLPGPGASWNAEPPRDTAVPVSDEMIETLVGGFPPESPEIGAAPDVQEIEVSRDDVDEQVASAIQAPDSRASTQPSIDHLLKIARELEYGLIELAETAGAEPATSGGPVDATGLGGVLAELQSDDDLQALRDAVETARQRPRDVDVMLDLVLRADAIAAVIGERDKLKSAIEAATGGSAPGDAAETGDGVVGDVEDADETDLDISDAADDDTESSPYAST